MNSNCAVVCFFRDQPHSKADLLRFNRALLKFECVEALFS